MPRDEPSTVPVNPSKKFYLVIAGTVGISQMAESGTEVRLGVVLSDELLGESDFFKRPSHPEQARTMTRARSMT
jgi:CRP-like cAMP-binding protein